MSKPFFTSDLHFFHKNVIEYCDRPWTFEEQTEQLINRWNSKVGKHDIVYHLGDFTFAGRKQASKVAWILQRLNGHKYFIRGNHDSDSLWSQQEVSDQVVWLKDYRETSIDGQKIILCHYPLASWNGMHRGSWMLHGHCHGSYQGDGKILDVGIDNHAQHQVFSWEEIEQFMATREIVEVDHHKEG